MSERLNKAHLIISLIAAIVVAIGFIVIHVYDVTHGLLLMAMWVSIAIILFYFIGHLARALLITNVFPVPEEEGDAEESSGEGDSDDEVVVPADYEMPEDDVMINSPGHDDMGGANGDVLNGEIMEMQPDHD